jgi:hypothetical protein
VPLPEKVRLTVRYDGATTKFQLRRGDPFRKVLAAVAIQHGVSADAASALQLRGPDGLRIGPFLTPELLPAALKRTIDAVVFEVCLRDEDTAAASATAAAAAAGAAAPLVYVCGML